LINKFIGLLFDHMPQCLQLLKIPALIKKSQFKAEPLGVGFAKVLQSALVPQAVNEWYLLRQSSPLGKLRYDPYWQELRGYSTKAIRIMKTDNSPWI
jgi:hypothetical protein